MLDCTLADKKGLGDTMTFFVAMLLRLFFIGGRYTFNGLNDQF